MKNLLTLIALLLVGVAIYLWANWIPEDKQAELVAGQYKLVDWSIYSDSTKADSLKLIHPAIGDIVELNLQNDGSFCIVADESVYDAMGLPVLEWKYMMTDRSWLGITHTVENVYGSGEGTELNAASIFLHRRFVIQTDVGMHLYVKDNANKQITWRLIYQKQ
jgi:hypothetical protein